MLSGCSIILQCFCLMLFFNVFLYSWTTSNIYIYKTLWLLTSQYSLSYNSHWDLSLSPKGPHPPSTLYTLFAWLHDLGVLFWWPTEFNWAFLLMDGRLFAGVGELASVRTPEDGSEPHPSPTSPPDNSQCFPRKGQTLLSPSPTNDGMESGLKQILLVITVWMAQSLNSWCVWVPLFSYYHFLLEKSEWLRYLEVAEIRLALLLT